MRPWAVGRVGLWVATSHGSKVMEEEEMMSVAGH